MAFNRPYHLSPEEKVLDAYRKRLRLGCDVLSDNVPAISSTPTERLAGQTIHTVCSQLGYALNAIEFRLAEIGRTAAASVDPEDCGGDVTAFDPVLDSVKFNGEPSDREIVRPPVTNILERE